MLSLFFYDWKEHEFRWKILWNYSAWEYELGRIISRLCIIWRKIIFNSFLKCHETCVTLRMNFWFNIVFVCVQMDETVVVLDMRIKVTAVLRQKQTRTHKCVSIILFNANNDKIAWFYSLKWNFRSAAYWLKTINILRHLLHQGIMIATL